MDRRMLIFSPSFLFFVENKQGTHDELSRIPGGEYARLLGHPGSDPEHLNE